MAMQTLRAHWRGRADYTVLDTAFDAGENFLATWHAWRESTERPTRLHYLAFVPRLYDVPALEAAHRQWPQWGVLAQGLRERWPQDLPGMHRILLPDMDVRLTLVLGETMQDLSRIDARVDTFLLDDKFFMRDGKQLRHDLTWLARLAGPKAQLVLPAEFDDAKLRAAGFAPDHGSRVALFAPSWQVEELAAPQRRAIVIGAGLAGANICHRLCARGWHVQLIERHPMPAGEASGNLAGIFMPVLARDDNPVARYSRAAFLFALRLWQELGGIGKAFDGAQCGVLQLETDGERYLSNDYPERFARLLDADEMRDILPGHERAWLFAQGGWANPASLCGAMLHACGINLVRHHGVSAARLEREADQWCVFDEHGTLLAQAPHVVLANGNGGKEFVQTQALPLAAVRGQVTHVDASRLPAFNMVLCGEGYVTPAWRGICTAGATYDGDTGPDLRMESQRENLARLTTLFPDFAASFDGLPLQGRTGFRCVAPDRLPLIGPLPDHHALAVSRAERLREVPRHAGLFALLGLASRGLTWAPLAAELLASQMSGEPLPLERDLCATLDPARFALQQHRSAKNRT